VTENARTLKFDEQGFERDWTCRRWDRQRSRRAACCLRHSWNSDRAP